jgi:hypothetical protein
MYDKNHLLILLRRIDESITLIFDQTTNINSPNDLKKTPAGEFKLNGGMYNLF